MRLRALVLSFLSLAAVLMPPGAAAQTGSIAGRVTDSARAEPVSGARIEVRDRSGRVVASASSLPSGRYQVERLGPGLYTVAFRSIGYAPKEVVGVSVANGMTAPIDAVLDTRPVLLPELILSVTGTRSAVPEPIQSLPVALTVISARAVQDRPALTVADHLEGVRGISISQGGLVQSNIVARGFNNIFSGALLTLIDNRYASVPSLRVNVPAFFSTTNDDIERVEFVLGPGAALYGPNASNGVLHLITKSPLTSPGTTITLEGGFRSGSQGSVGDAGRLDDGGGVGRVGFRHASRITPKIGFKISGEYLKGTDWRYADRGDTLSPTAKSASGKRICRGPFGCRDFGLERWSGELRLDVKPDSTTEWITSGGHTDAVNLLEPTRIGTAQARHWTSRYVQTRLRRKSLFVQAFVNESDAGQTFLLRDGNLIVDQSRVMALQAQHGLKIGKRETVVYGADYTFTDPRTGGTINGSNENQDGIKEIGAYVHSVTRLSSKVDLFSALRLDRHNRFEGVVWSPRVAVVVKPTDDHSVRVTYNRAFSTPTSLDLFLDIAADQAGPYTVRALGVPTGGFRFRLGGGCAGGIDDLCMRSPFTPVADLLPARANLLWQAAVEIVAPHLDPTIAQVLRGIPAAVGVGTTLARLNPTTGSFDPVEPTAIRDISALKPTISNILEAGYLGTLAGKLRLAVDGYYERRENFVGPLIVESPSVFLDRTTLLALLRQAYRDAGYPPPAADQVADGVGAAMLEIPLATVVPNDGNSLTNRPDIFLTSRNFGTVSLFGFDAAVDYVIDPRLALAATYSWVNKDLFSREEVNGPTPIALNASKSRGSIAARVQGARDAWSSELRFRYVKGFPVSSGVFMSPTLPNGTLEPLASYGVFDLQASWRPPVRGRNLLIAATISNVFDRAYATFVGVPRIGRLFLTKASYTF